MNRCLKPNLFEINLSVHGFAASWIMRWAVMLAVGRSQEPVQYPEGALLYRSLW